MNSRSSHEDDATIFTYRPNKRPISNSKATLTKVIPNAIVNTQSLMTTCSQLVNQKAPCKFTIKINAQNFKNINFINRKVAIDSGGCKPTSLLRWC